MSIQARSKQQSAWCLPGTHGFQWIRLDRSGRRIDDQSWNDQCAPSTKKDPLKKRTLKNRDARPAKKSQTPLPLYCRANGFLLGVFQSLIRQGVIFADRRRPEPAPIAALADWLRAK